MIQVFYEELNYETLSESVAYTFTSLIADLGGLSGLWIGISVVSVLELLQLGWFCIDYWRNRKKQRKLSLDASTYPDRVAQKRSTSSSGGRPTSRKSTGESLRFVVPGAGVAYREQAAPAPHVVPPVAVVIQEETDEDGKVSSSSTSSTKGSAHSGHRTLGPDEDLPCTCLYGSRGQIVFMKPLCPFHGYMVRRCSIYSTTEEKGEDEGDKSSSSTSSSEEEGENITPEERQVLKRETDREGARHREKRGESSKGREKEKDGGDDG